LKIVAAVYSHPEYYPPTLNAMEQLSQHTERIVLLHRNVKPKEWHYPENVFLKSSGSFKGITATQNESVLWKLISFIRFSIDFFKVLRKEKPNWVIAYDPIPLLSYRIISFFVLKKPKIWYHNHDILELKNTRSFSVSRCAVKSEKSFFNKIDLFSLPAQERKSSFLMNNFKGKYIYLPNYPSISHSNKNHTINFKKKNIDFIFQGSISYNHGLEEILCAIPNLNREFNKNFRLVIKGFIDKDYSEHLQNIARKNQVSESLIVIGVGPYQEVFEISANCDIGLAIHTADNLMNKTLATSSNKIYEYIAVGLPVLLYDNEHFKSHLKKRTWAFFTNITQKSIIENVGIILESYPHISQSALSDFRSELNFEHNFSSVISFLLTK